jgi:arsenate reductase
LLEDEGLAYRYREYTEKPLSAAELKTLFGKLRCSPRDVLRKRDAKTHGLSGDESDAELIKAMAEHPTLLERPIGVKGRRAVVGRPVENLLELA